MTQITYEIKVKNTGTQYDLIAGVSVFDNNWDFVVDLPWFIIWDVPTGTQYTVTIPATLTSNLPTGNYYARARAWENYDLTGASEYGDLDSVGRAYLGGSLYGTTPGDGVCLDQMDKSFSVAAGQISAEINDLIITVS